MATPLESSLQTSPLKSAPFVWRVSQSQLLRDLSSKTRGSLCPREEAPLPFQDPEIRSLQAVEKLQEEFYSAPPEVQARHVLC